MTPAVTSWAPVDLGPILDGIAAGEITGPTPTLMPRSDGVRLLYGGELHSLAGEPESGKGWLALAEGGRVMVNGGRVLYIDFEDTAPNVLARLVALGILDETIADRLVYVQPADPLKPADLKRLLGGSPFALAILDGMSEAYALLGLDSYSNTDVPKFLAQLARPIAATGAAVVLIDHVTKAKEGRGRFAIGAQHKLAGIAVAYGVEVIEPPSRQHAGRIKLTIHKDRHGHIRGHAAHGVISIAHIEPTDDGDTVTVTLAPPDAAPGSDFRPTRLMERISRVIEETPGLGVKDLRERIHGSRDAFKDLAIAALRDEGHIEIRTDRRARRHYPLHPYRETPDNTVAERGPNVAATPDDGTWPVAHPLRGATDTTTSNHNGHHPDRVPTLLDRNT